MTNSDLTQRADLDKLLTEHGSTAGTQGTTDADLGRFAEKLRQHQTDDVEQTDDQEQECDADQHLVVIANNLTEEEVGRVLGADMLIYQSVEDLIAVGKEHNPMIDTFDASCFNAHYVTKGITEEFLFELEMKGRGKRQFKSAGPVGGRAPQIAA